VGVDNSEFIYFYGGGRMCFAEQCPSLCAFFEVMFDTGLIIFSSTCAE
jgi:hypothetical protein